MAVRRPPGQVTAQQVRGRRGGKSRAAFTLTEVLIGAAILAVLAAAIVPTIYGRLQQSRADAIIAEMQSFQNGIMMFYRDVGRYPRRLDYLNTLAVGDLDSCGLVAIPDPNVGRFRGPYINRSITLINPPGNTKFLMATGDSVQSVLTRTSITTATGSQQVLQISVHGVDADISELMDYKVDGNAGIDVGIIHIAGAIVKWTLPIRTGAC